MYCLCLIAVPSIIHLMRATEVSLRRREQKYILQLIQALQNVHLFFAGCIKPILCIIQCIERIWMAKTSSVINLQFK